jgi:A/G-specific adenine glycosylase
VAPVALAEMQSAVLDWYAANARDLAFRRTTDPWAILVSEVIAQQTQAARAAEAWTRFIDQFPIPAGLAAASPATVLRAWRGLGYNRRALALRRAAIAIVEDHGGRVPDSLDELVRLPGVGPYTARAVLAIAFNQPVAALDTNIRRVLSRAFIAEPHVPAATFQALADALVPAGRAATWTHALMDVGAAFCRKRDPRCAACPLRAYCTFATQPPSRQPGSAKPSSNARGAIRFESTTRWLRGRILDYLRDAPDGHSIAFATAIGTHHRDAIREALEDLAAEGLLELDPSATAARFPID